MTKEAHIEGYEKSSIDPRIVREKHRNFIKGALAIGIGGVGFLAGASFAKGGVAIFRNSENIAQRVAAKNLSNLTPSETLSRRITTPPESYVPGTGKTEGIPQPTQIKETPPTTSTTTVEETTLLGQRIGGATAIAGGGVAILGGGLALGGVKEVAVGHEEKEEE